LAAFPFGKDGRTSLGGEKMSGETKKLGAGATFLLGVVTFGFVTYFARTSSDSLGTWIVALTMLVVVVALAGKLVQSAPTFVRDVAARLTRRPAAFFFWCAVIGGGGWTGRTIHAGHVQACTVTAASTPSVR
jgi:hypothetical protein